MATINLLPQELKPKGYVVKLTLRLKKIATSMAIIFFVLVVFLGGAILILTLSMRSSIQRQESLKAEIKLLEDTEQRLVLIRDRLNKVDLILSEKDANEAVSILKDVNGILPQESSISEARLMPDGLDLTLTTTTSSSLTQIFANLVSFPDIKKIELVRMEYSQVGGYRLRLSLAR